MPDNGHMHLRTMRTSRLTLLGALAVFCGAASLAPSIGETAHAAPDFSRAPIATPLTVVRNGVFTASGARMILGGIHRTGYTTATGDSIGDAEADALAPWTSMVRIASNASLVADPCDSGGVDYLTRLDGAVTALTSRNVVALIDLHKSAPTPCTTSRQLPLPGADQATAFWTTIAQRYSSNPLVAFELWNEPHGITTAQWVNGGVLDDGTGSPYLAAGMQQLYDTVASVSTSNLILVDPPGYSSDPSVVSSNALRINAARTVWAIHAYTCVQPSDTVCINDPVKRVFPANKPPMGAWDSLSFSRAIVVSETGFPDPNSSTWFTGATAWSAKHTPAIGITGFADDGSWAGSPWRLTSAAPLWAPNAAGQPLADYMKKVQPPTAP